MALPILQTQFALLTPPTTILTLGSIPTIGNTLLLVVGTNTVPPLATVFITGLVWSQIAATALGGGTHQFEVYQAAVSSLAGVAVTILTAANVVGYASLVEAVGTVSMLTTARAAAAPLTIPAPTGTFPTGGLSVDAGDAYHIDLVTTTTIPPANPG